jgi:hypothetical protein
MINVPKTYRSSCQRQIYRCKVCESFHTVPLLQCYPCCQNCSNSVQPQNVSTELSPWARLWDPYSNSLTIILAMLNFWLPHMRWGFLRSLAPVNIMCLSAPASLPAQKFLPSFSVTNSLSQASHEHELHGKAG